MGWTNAIGGAEAGNRYPCIWHSQQSLSPEAFQLFGGGSCPDLDHPCFPKQIVYMPSRPLSLPQVAGQAGRKAAGTPSAANIEVITSREMEGTQPANANLSFSVHMEHQYVSTRYLHISSIFADLARALCAKSYYNTKAN